MKLSDILNVKLAVCCSIGVAIFLVGCSPQSDSGSTGHSEEQSPKVVFAMPFPYGDYKTDCSCTCEVDNGNGTTSKDVITVDTPFGGCGTIAAGTTCDLKSGKKGKVSADACSDHISPKPKGQLFEVVGDTVQELKLP